MENLKALFAHYSQTQQQAIAVVKSFAQRLKTYSLKTDANPRYIETQNANLTDLSDFINCVDLLVSGYRDLLKQRELALDLCAVYHYLKTEQARGGLSEDEFGELLDKEFETRYRLYQIDPDTWGEAMPIHRLKDLGLVA